MAGGPVAGGHGHDRFERAGRFTALQESARALIDELTTTYRVGRTEGTDLDPFTADEWPGAPSVRLVPPAGAAPLTFVFGDERFPGVDLHPGWGGSFLLPGCFCDRCDEDVDETIERMRRVIEAVTNGRYSEARVSHLTGPDTYHDVTWDDAERRMRSDRLPASIEATMRKGEADWAPWSPTAAQVVAQASAAITEMVWDRGGDLRAFRGVDVRLDGDTVVLLIRRSGDDHLIGARFPAPLLPRAGLMYADILMRTTEEWLEDVRIALMEELGTGADQRPPLAAHDGWSEIHLWTDPFLAATSGDAVDWRSRPPMGLGDNTRRWRRERPWWRW